MYLSIYVVFIMDTPDVTFCEYVAINCLKKHSHMDFKLIFQQSKQFLTMLLSNIKLP